MRVHNFFTCLEAFYMSAFAGNHKQYLEAFYQACTVGTPDLEAIEYILSHVSLISMFVMLGEAGDEDEITIKKVTTCLEVIFDSSKGFELISAADMVPYLKGGLTHPHIK